MTLRSLPTVLRLALPLWLVGAATLALAVPEPRLPREGLCLNNLYQGTLDGTQARLFLARDGNPLLGMVEIMDQGKYDPAADRLIFPRRWYSGPLGEDGRFELVESDSDGRLQGPAGEGLSGSIDAEGVLTGDWQRPGNGPAPLRFQPTDTLTLGQAPPFRLRLEPTPEGIDWGAKVWLAIGDGPETLVTDSRGAAAAPCIGREPHEARADHLNPDSLSVRPLPSDPPVYWIRYEIRGATGSSQGLERRHRVVRADAQEVAVFNEWSKEYSGGNQGFDSEQTVDYRIEAQGTTLSIIDTTLGGEESDMSDCGLCAYAHEDCQGFCEYFGFRCIYQGGEGFDACEERCRRNCERDAYVAECLAGKATLQQWSRHRRRQIDARTGQTLNDSRTEVGEYLTGWFRCGAEKSRYFLVLDDGRAAWLLVREASAEPWPVPGPAAALPAVASCWLYNRGAGAVAEGPGPYPPAALDQVRPGVAPPAGCCLVETDPSGRLTRVFARQDPEDDGDAGDSATKGRLLAVFDAQSGYCFSADLIADGPLGHALTPAVAPHERIALASAIRRRVAPDPEAEEILHFRDEAGQEVAQRLALGTPVLALGRSALASRIDGVEDHWYWVAAPDGIAGWVFGALLAPLDPAHPEGAWRQVVERAIAARAQGQTDAKELAAFLGRLAADLPGPAVDAAAMDPRELLARVERHQRDCREPQGGPLPQARRVPPETRLTVGAGVRVRPAPRLGCGLLERLPIGTPVKVQRRTAEKTRVGAETDYWYEIETPAGVSGWVFGALLTPFDPAHPGRAWRTLIERQRRSPPDSLRAAVDWLDWQGRVRPKLPPDLLPDLELARLDGIRAIDEAPGLGLSPLGSPWAAPHLVGLDAFIEGDELHLSAAYWVWHDRYPGHPAAEHAAWQATRDPTWLHMGLTPYIESDEGMGEDVDLAIDLLAHNPLVRYLGLHPRGAHADEARREVEDTIVYLSAAMDGYGDELATPAFVCRDEALVALRSARAALEPIAGKQAAALRARITALLGIECPPTAVEPTASDGVPAGPGEP